MTDLAEVLQDDGDVHVNDDQEGHDEVRHEVGDCQAGVAAVAIRLDVGDRVVTAGRSVVHKTRQYTVPPGRRTRLYTKVSK